MSERLSPIETVMWRAGQDPTLRMTIGTLVVLDQSPSRDALVARLEAAVSEVPRLAAHPERLAAGPGRPTWTADDDHAVEYHVRSLALAAPGSMRDLLDLVGLLESVPFDPLRSPWDVTLIDGLEGGRAALYLRAHHVLTDGVGGVRLVGLILDEPGWPAATAAPLDADDDDDDDDDDDATSNGSGRRAGTFTLTIDLPRGVRRLLRSFEAARDVDPLEAAMRGAQRALDIANSVSRQLMPNGDSVAANSAPPSMLSHYEVVVVDGAREAALALGGSRNDLLVAGAAAGLGRYYERLGRPAHDLRLVTPTTRRRTHAPGGNWFAPTRLEVPTDVSRPARQFGVVAERLAQARCEPALRVATGLATTAGYLPTSMLLSALHAQAASVDFAATAVPGLRGARHICGSLIEAAYPLGPRLGCPMNVTALGNEDRLDIGVAIDPNVLDQPDLLVECLVEAFGILAAGSVASDRDPKPAR